MSPSKFGTLLDKRDIRVLDMLSTEEQIAVESCTTSPTLAPLIICLPGKKGFQIMLHPKIKTTFLLLLLGIRMILKIIEKWIKVVEKNGQGKTETVHFLKLVQKMVRLWTNVSWQWQKWLWIENRRMNFNFLIPQGRDWGILYMKHQGQVRKNVLVNLLSSSNLVVFVIAIKMI